MDIPAPVRQILQRLRDRGFAAYAVGGCVRDTLLGRTPGDWDICTSALPEETEQCFPDLRVIETGLKHGTVTVLLAGAPYEITTFRRDGDYLDHRRPEQVAFVSSLEEDLRRRDFTINAMALGLEGEVIDRFGGRADLNRRIIRCVGDPEQRFREDALRILRGMRFAAQLEFTLDPDTAAAMERCKDLLALVSGERIYTEMTKLLVGPGAAKVLEQYGSILTGAFPELLPAMGFLQRNPCHNRDVWGHTVEALGYSVPDPTIRWVLLLHDLGKPDCFSVDEKGVGHFYGHPRRSEEIARQIMGRLHPDKNTAETICTLVRHHDDGAPVERRSVRRWIGRYGPERLEQLLEVKRADCLAHAEIPRTRQRYEAVLAFRELTKQVLAEESCFQVKDLELSGRDLLAAGVAPGPELGRLLGRLLEDVLEDRCENRREALLERLNCYLREKGQDNAD